MVSSGHINIYQQETTISPMAEALVAGKKVAKGRQDSLLDGVARRDCPRIGMDMKIPVGDNTISLTDTAEFKILQKTSSFLPIHKRLYPWRL